MRKDVLQQMINKYRNQRFFHNHERIKVFEDFLQTEKIRLLSAHENISFRDLSQYIFEKHSSVTELLDLVTEISVRICKNSYMDPFRAFINLDLKSEITKEVELSVFGKQSTHYLLLPELWDQIASYLDHSSHAKLSEVSRFFYRTSNGYLAWKDKLAKSGCANNLLEQTKGIKNYKNLYYALLMKQSIEARIASAVLLLKQRWVLAVLSGDPSAIEYAITHLCLTNIRETAAGTNALQLVICTGNRLAVEYVLNKLIIDPKRKDNFGYNATDYAYLYCDIRKCGWDYYYEVKQLFQTEANIVLQRKAEEQRRHYSNTNGYGDGCGSY